MITELILTLFGGFFDSLMAFVDGSIPPPPGWAAEGSFYVADVMATAASLDRWVPISLAAPIMLFIPVAMAAGIAIKLTRIAISFMTLGGGSAA